MSCVRVNLLRPEEIRQQASLSRESVIRVCTMIGSAIVIASLLMAGFEFFRLRHGLSSARETWSTLGGDYERIKGMHDQHLSNQNYVLELEGWTKSRVEWVSPLTALQDLVPANIQLTRVSVQGEIQVSEAEPPTDEAPGTPARTFRVRVEGKAQGSLSDQDVIRFVDRLRVDDAYASWLDSIKLQGLQRTLQNARVGAPEERVFRVDAVSRERLMSK